VSTEDVDAYVAGLAPEGAAFVRELRRRVHAVRDDVTEELRYDIPTFQVGGRSRVHVAAWKKHVSVYPVPDPLPDGLAAHVAGKGTLRFPLGTEVPWDDLDLALRELLR
jgi:uncharacterized protein YdhG (YjbR/CyaY superfamily)